MTTHPMTPRQHPALAAPLAHRRRRLARVAVRARVPVRRQGRAGGRRGGRARGAGRRRPEVFLSRFRFLVAVFFWPEAAEFF